MADKDFKVKNGLIVSDSATVGSQLTVDGNIVVGGTATITGNTTFQGDVSIDGSFSGEYTGFDSDFTEKSTSDLSEGSNLYYTTARVDSAIDVRVDSAFLDKLAKDYASLTGTQTLTNKTIVDPVIDSTGLYGLQYGGLSVNTDGQLGGATQTVLNVTSKPANADAVLSLGVNGQYHAAIGATGTAADGTLYMGMEGTTTGFTITSNVGTAPFDFANGTDLLEMTAGGQFDIKNTTEATSKTNAALVVRGGIGADKNIRGQDIIAANNIQANGQLLGTLSAASLSARSTDDLSEGSTNRYFTDARVDSYINASILTTDVSEGTNLYYTTARTDSDAKRAISISDNGGDGSLTYSESTGVITYTGPSATEVRAHFSGGTGVTITNGVVAIGQSVTSADSVEFSGATFSGNVTITGDLVVGGGYFLDSQQDLRVRNALIKLADSNTADTVDIGVVGRYSQDGGSTIRRAGFFRDASNGEWYTFTNLIQDNLDSEPSAQTINVDDPSFQLGTWNFGALRGTYLGFDSDFAAFSSNYTVYDSDFTAVNAGRYAIDTSGGQVTVTLPANPETGDYVRLIDVANFTTNSCIVNRNGETIEGLTENFELDLGQSIIEFIYINSNWQVYTSIGQRGPQGPKGDSADAGTFASQAQSIAFSVALG
jgi:hypothetical protein